jgi:hypothetical protein
MASEVTNNSTGIITPDEGKIFLISWEKQQREQH